MNKFPFKLTKPTDELKKLITEHPDYPIVVLAGEEANSGDYCWMYCSDISFGVEEILCCEAPWNEEIVETDRDHFTEEVEEWLFDKMVSDIYDSTGENLEPSEEEFQRQLAEVKAEYEPYWTKVIAIWADN